MPLKEKEIRYTEKQIEKYRRQKYMTELEKITKNLFRMLRDNTVTSDKFTEKFTLLKEKTDDRVSVQLDSEYHRQIEAYIDRLYRETVLSDTLTDEKFDDIREAEMSNLNRLQKLKNSNTYKKEKHKSQSRNEDWG
ncbi:MAG: hypothetical protein U9Q90_10710 [Campylobacterota bacterium]|nr:hypothetical protein [Campylobacterota bacterium]